MREITRLASLGLPHAGNWLNVVPSPSLGLQMHQSEFIMLVKYLFIYIGRRDVVKNNVRFIQQYTLMTIF